MADFNGEGRSGIAISSTALAVYPGKADGTFTLAPANTASNMGTLLAVLDFNGDGKLDLIAGRNPMTLLLGMAEDFHRTPDQATGGCHWLGRVVRFYTHYIREAALRRNQPYPTVLSYAMAHEIGHVLLRSNHHDKWRLTSSVWTGHEYAQMSIEGTLFFSADESMEF